MSMFPVEFEKFLETGFSAFDASVQGIQSTFEEMVWNTNDEEKESSLRSSRSSPGHRRPKQGDILVNSSTTGTSLVNSSTTGTSLTRSRTVPARRVPNNRPNNRKQYARKKSSTTAPTSPRHQHFHERLRQQQQQQKQARLERSSGKYDPYNTSHSTHNRSELQHQSALLDTNSLRDEEGGSFTDEFEDTTCSGDDDHTSFTSTSNQSSSDYTGDTLTTKEQQRLDAMIQRRANAIHHKKNQLPTHVQGKPRRRTRNRSSADRTVPPSVRTRYKKETTKEEKKKTKNNRPQDTTHTIEALFRDKAQIRVTRTKSYVGQDVGLDFSVVEYETEGRNQGILIVSTIEVGSVFAATDLQIGDVILAINGIPFQPTPGELASRGVTSMYRPSAYKARKLLNGDCLEITIVYQKFGDTKTSRTTAASLTSNALEDTETAMVTSMLRRRNEGTNLPSSVHSRSMTLQGDRTGSTRSLLPASTSGPVEVEKQNKEHYYSSTRKKIDLVPSATPVVQFAPQTQTMNDTNDSERKRRTGTYLLGFPSFTKQTKSKDHTPRQKSRTASTTKKKINTSTGSSGHSRSERTATTRSTSTRATVDSRTVAIMADSSPAVGHDRRAPQQPQPSTKSSSSKKRVKKAILEYNTTVSVKNATIEYCADPPPPTAPQNETKIALKLLKLRERTQKLRASGQKKIEASKKSLGKVNVAGTLRGVSRSISNKQDKKEKEKRRKKDEEKQKETAHYNRVPEDPPLSPSLISRDVFRSVGVFSGGVDVVDACVQGACASGANNTSSIAMVSPENSLHDDSSFTSSSIVPLGGFANDSEDHYAPSSISLASSSLHRYQNNPSTTLRSARLIYNDDDEERNSSVPIVSPPRNLTRNTTPNDDDDETKSHSTLSTTNSVYYDNQIRLLKERISTRMTIPTQSKRINSGDGDNSSIDVNIDESVGIDAKVIKNTHQKNKITDGDVTHAAVLDGNPLCTIEEYESMIQQEHSKLRGNVDSNEYQKELIRINRKVFEKLHGRIDQLIRSNTQLSTEVHSLQSESSETARKFFNMTSQLKKVRDRERCYQSEIESLKSISDDAIIQQDRRQKEMYLSKQQLKNDHNEEVTDLTSRIVTLETTNQDLRNQMEKLQQDHDQLQQSNERQLKDVRFKEGKQDPLVPQESDPQEKRRFEDLLFQVERLQRKLDSQSTLLDNVMTTNEELTTQNVQMDQELSKLLSSSYPSKSSENDDEDDNIDSTHSRSHYRSKAIEVANYKQRNAYLHHRIEKLEEERSKLSFSHISVATTSTANNTSNLVIGDGNSSSLNDTKGSHPSEGDESFNHFMNHNYQTNNYNNGFVSLASNTSSNQDVHRAMQYLRDSNSNKNGGRTDESFESANSLALMGQIFELENALDNREMNEEEREKIVCMLQSQVKRVMKKGYEQKRVE